jgi:hypothetical protein
MPISWVSIANMGLRRIGVSSVVTSLAGTDKASTVFNDTYEAARDAVLEDFDWSCASTRAVLAMSTTTPAYDWLYQYALPSSPWCLVVREMYPVTSDYVVEGRNLLTNQDNFSDIVAIRFTARLNDPTLFSAKLAKAIAWRWAAENCYAFVQGIQLQNTILKEYMAILNEAESADAYQNKNHDEDAPMEEFNIPGIPSNQREPTWFGWLSNWLTSGR